MSTNFKKKRFFRSNSLSRNKAVLSHSSNKSYVPPVSGKFPVSVMSGVKSLVSGSRSSDTKARRCLELLDVLIHTQGPIKNELTHIKEVFEACSEKKYEQRIQELMEENKRLAAELTKRDRSDSKEVKNENNNNSQIRPRTKKHVRSNTDMRIGDLIEKMSSAGTHLCFQDEFMSKADEFSESWRIMIKDQKN